MSDNETLAEFIQRDRDRISAEREELRGHMDTIARQLTALDNEMLAIAAYETAKSGKVARRPRANGATRGPRQGSRSEAIIQTVTNNPGGLKRGELIDTLGLKGDKSGEMSVSNALTSLVKANVLTRVEGKYVLAV